MTKIKLTNIFYHEQIENFSYFSTRVHPLPGAKLTRVCKSERCLC